MKALLLVLILACATPIMAQETYRELMVNDSTSYTYNADSSIVAGRQKLYWNTAAGLSLITDFSSFGATKNIRDFNRLSDDRWYVIYGGTLWGDSASVYTSNNQGNTWDLDTSYLSVTRQAENIGLIAQHYAVFQLNELGPDTLVLFVSYYQSGLFYSTDNGQTWNTWFANFSANYRGLLPCGNDYFLWGVFGDGFPAYTFKFDGDLLFSPDTNGAWTSAFNPNGYHRCPFDTVNCITALDSLGEYGQYLFFKSHVDSACAPPTSITEVAAPLDLQLYPNPTHTGLFTVAFDQPMVNGNLTVIQPDGRLVHQETITFKDRVQVDLTRFGQGLFIVLLHDGQRTVSRKIIVQPTD